MNPAKRLLAAVLCCAPGLSAPPARAAEPTTLQHVEKDMEKIRKHFRSAEIKLRKGAVGMSSTDDGQPATLGQRCCSGNLDHMGDGLSSMRKHVAALGQCYEGRRDRLALDALDLVNEDMDTLTKGLSVFRSTTTPQDATGALDGSKRAYINLYRSVAELTECPAVPEAAAVDDGEGDD